MVPLGGCQELQVTQSPPAHCVTFYMGSEFVSSALNKLRVTFSFPSLTLHQGKLLGVNFQLSGESLWGSPFLTQVSRISFKTFMLIWCITPYFAHVDFHMKSLTTSEGTWLSTLQKSSISRFFSCVHMLEPGPAHILKQASATLVWNARDQSLRTNDLQGSSCIPQDQGSKAQAQANLRW